MADEGELVPVAEIKRITKRDQPAAQVRALKRMGVPCRLERGEALVSRQHLREWIAGGTSASVDEANWSAVN